MIAAAIPYILQGASLLGGMIGKKKKVLDPEYMRQHFGSGAIADEAARIQNKILASSYGNQLMSSAAQDAQRFQTGVNSRVAAAGLDPSGGGESGASNFAVAAGGSAQGAMERGVKSDIYREALPQAQQQIAQQRADYEQAREEENAKPSIWQKIGQVAGATASMFPTAPGVGAAGGPAGVTPEIAGVVQRAAAATPSMLSTDASPTIMGNVRRVSRARPRFSASSFASQPAAFPWQR
jgi:hypothetical protein